MPSSRSSWKCTSPPPSGSLEGLVHWHVGLVVPAVTIAERRHEVALREAKHRRERKMAGNGVARVLDPLEVEVFLGAVMAEAVEGNGLAVHELDPHSALVRIVRGCRQEPHHIGALAGNVSVYIKSRH